MTRRFVKGARAFCTDTTPNNIQGLRVGEEYTIIEENHIIDDDEYILVQACHGKQATIRAKVDYFA